MMASEERAMQLSQRSVAIVTANRFEAKLVGDVLHAAGAPRAVFIDHSDEALAALSSDACNIVLVDLDATPVPGLDFVRALRRNARSRSRRALVFLLTRKLTASVVEACRLSGANAVIGLPVSNATLLTTIKRVIANPRPFVEENGYVGPCRRAGIISAGRGSGRCRSDTSTRGAA
jgi:CheY-like chemotaxis protein